MLREGTHLFAPLRHDGGENAASTVLAQIFSIARTRAIEQR
jgi:hypothetical protein